MSYIYLPFDSVQQLVERLQSVDLIRDAVLPHHTDPKPNLVLIDPVRYYGSYGGLVNDTVLQKLNLDEKFVASTLCPGLSVVWWSLKTPPLIGEIRALSVHNRVVVTVPLFQTLVENAVRSSRPRSSYYTGFNGSRKKTAAYWKSSFE